MEEYDEGEGDGWGDEGWQEEDDPALSHHISEGALDNVKGYICHSSDQIEERQAKVINEVTELLGLSEDDAIT